MGPEREPGDGPPALSTEAVEAAAREDLIAIARGRLCVPAWRAGHCVGFVKGAAWAARILGATLIRRPPDRPRTRPRVERDTLDEI